MAGEVIKPQGVQLWSAVTVAYTDPMHYTNDAAKFQTFASNIITWNKDRGIEPLQNLGEPFATIELLGASNNVFMVQMWMSQQNYTKLQLCVCCFTDFLFNW